MKHPEIIQKLTLGQKASLMSGENIWQSQEIKNLIPSLFLSDGPHGVRKQMGESDHLGLNESVPATCFPTSATLANSWDEELVENVGICLGEEAKAFDVQVLLGPGLNIKRNPKSGRNFEYYSEDPYLAGKMAAATIRGIQSTGTIACPKHFAVNSQENRRMASDSIVDERTKREIYLSNFEIAVKEGQPKSIMSAYNLVDGSYANENKELLLDILREEWGFEGFVVSDWGGDNDRVAAIENGSHLAMPGQSVNGPLEVVEAVKSGRLAENILDERVDQLIDVILQSTAKLTVSNQEDIHQKEEQIDWRGHHQIAKEAAMKSVVLLKNEQVLPLTKNQRVGIVGDFAKSPRYQGAGSSMVNPKNLEAPLDVLKDYELNVTGFAQGYTRGGTRDEDLENEAVALATNSDVVLVYAGLDEISESEGMDRLSMKMPDSQVQLIEKLATTKAQIIVVLAAGSVIEMPWADKVEGIVHGYLSGEAGASGVLEVLVGNYNPSGKLNESYPMVYDDVLFGEKFPVNSRYSYYQEGIFVGYRYYDTVNKNVRYPFGHGLSYTQFDYSDLKVTESGIELTLTNSGKVAGAEIVQVYVGKADSNVLRPAKELKQFKKVFLEAGESKQLTLAFDDKTFRVYDVTAGKWVTEAGEYQLYIGSSSRDIRLTGVCNRQGVTLSFPNEKSYLEKDFEQLNLDDFKILYRKSLPIESTQSIQDLHRNSVISEMKYAKNPLARFVYRRLQKMLDKSLRKQKPDLNILFIYNMPFRGIAKMTNGMVSMEMVDNMLVMVNGHFFKGFGKLIKSFLSNRKQLKVNLLEE